MLPDWSLINRILAVLANPQVTSIYGRRTLLLGIGVMLLILGFAVMIAGTKAGQAALSAGGKVAETAVAA